VAFFAVLTSCSTLLMCSTLPFSNRSTSHGACPEYCYTVPAKVKVLRKRKYSIEDQGGGSDTRVTMPMVMPPPPNIHQKKKTTTQRKSGFVSWGKSAPSEPSDWTELQIPEECSLSTSAFFAHDARMAGWWCPNLGSLSRTLSQP
jgi:hypothetical protein